MGMYKGLLIMVFVLVKGIQCKSLLNPYIQKVTETDILMNDSGCKLTV